MSHLQPHSIQIGGHITASAAGIALNLDGCLDKLSRAQEHFDTLEHELWRFFDSDPYGALGEIEADHGWYVFRVEIRRKPSPRIGVLLGEFAYQLRSTLDHLMWGLASWHMLPRTPPQGTVFPIQTKRAGADRLMARLKGRIPDDWHAFIEALQPIGRHDDPLAVLEHLWNRDKHEAVVPTPITKLLTVGGVEFLPNRDAGPVLDRRARMGVSLEDGAELARVKINPQGSDPRVDMYTQPPVFIGTEDGRPLLEPLTFAEGMIRGLVATFPGGESAFGWTTPTGNYRTAITTAESDDEARRLGFFIADRSR